jgi:hypothetical protein
VASPTASTIGIEKYSTWRIEFLKRVSVETRNSFFMKNLHKDCVKTQRHYATCDCVAFEIRKIIRHLRSKGIKCENNSDLITSLILEKSEALLLCPKK